MSVYKLIPSHYVRLQQPARPVPEALPPPCTAEQFENLTLLLRTSNAKLAGLAATIRDLRDQLRDRDATIAALRTRLQLRAACSVSSNVEVTSGVRPAGTQQPEDVVVDVSSDTQVRLRVELVDQGASRPPLVKVASTVVTRRPATASSPAPTAATSAATTPGDEKQAAPGPVRSAGHGAKAACMASPLYASLMWRTRQRAKELGYRFVWSRYGKILVKKDVQSPPMYILEETDLRKMG